MSEVQGFQKPKRAVAIRRDGDDFVVSLMPDDHVIYRHGSAFALRKICEQLRWAVVSDTATMPPLLWQEGLCESVGEATSYLVTPP
jgi:hypothetical protein